MGWPVPACLVAGLLPCTKCEFSLKPLVFGLLLGWRGASGLGVTGGPAAASEGNSSWMVFQSAVLILGRRDGRGGGARCHYPWGLQECCPWWSRAANLSASSYLVGGPPCTWRTWSCGPGWPGGSSCKNCDLHGKCMSCGGMVGQVSEASRMYRLDTGHMSSCFGERRGRVFPRLLDQEASMLGLMTYGTDIFREHLLSPQGVVQGRVQTSRHTLQVNSSRSCVILSSLQEGVCDASSMLCKLACSSSRADVCIIYLSA
eukprot:1138228-Pelagomonas_calceolata.AAC.1